MLVVATGILLVAAFAQAVSGFGYALIAVPLLAVTIDPQVAVVTATVGSLTMTILIMVVERAHINRRLAFWLSVASLAGMPFGLLLLRLLPDIALTAVIAVVTLACTVLVWRGWRMDATPSRIAGAGAISGFLLTSTGTNGPPLVAVLQGLELSPRAFRATLATVFTASGVIGTLGFAASGVITHRTLVVVAIALATSVIGGWTGHRVARNIDASRFRRIVIGGLVLSSSIALARAGVGLL